MEFVKFSVGSTESVESRPPRFWRSKVVVSHGRGPVPYEVSALQSRGLALGRVYCRVACTSRAAVAQLTVQAPLEGPADYRVGRQRIGIGPGEAILLPAGHEYTARLSAGSALFVQVDAAALMGSLPTGRAGRVRHWAVRCVPIDVSRAFGPGVQAEIASLLESPELSAYVDQPARFADLERRILSSLTTSLLDRGSLWSFVPAGLRLAERAGEWIDSDLLGPITVEGLAERFEVTGRWLQKCFMARWGMAPMEYVTSRRLSLARSLLLSPGHHSVTSVAARCGFSHLGRFAGLYGRTYGESPSETIARIRMRQQSRAVANLT